MALTVSGFYKWALQPSEFISIIKVVGDTSYPSGGYSITPTMFALNTFASTSDFQLQAPPAQPFGIWIDASAGGYAQTDSSGNLRLFVAAGTELGTGSTAAGFSTVLVAFGH